MKIINYEIVGIINDIHSMNGIGLHDNLQEKLDGKIPIENKLELLELINSWGRNDTFHITISQNLDIEINESQPKECYNLSKLDVSKIKDMSDIFIYSKFNRDISNWDTSNVVNMDNMFYKSKFNNNISKWDVSNVTSMNLMFSLTNFNQPLNNWNTSKVTSMKSMFYFAKNFNQPIGNLDTSNVNNMAFMFLNATSFNQDISKWDVSKVETMYQTF